MFSTQPGHETQFYSSQKNLNAYYLLKATLSSYKVYYIVFDYISDILDLLGSHT